jgi:hypothetical protein
LLGLRLASGKFYSKPDVNRYREKPGRVEQKPAGLGMEGI